MGFVGELMKAMPETREALLAYLVPEKREKILCALAQKLDGGYVGELIIAAERAALPVIGYVIQRGNAIPVRQGDVVKKHKMFASEAVAIAVLQAIQGRCDHHWIWQSHEERHCPRCYAEEFMPDL